MKSYTDIEQSKKLAKILPPESADMCWGIDDDIMRYSDEPYLNPYRSYITKKYYVPCWSLASLLELMPKQFGRYTKSLYWFDNAWHCDYMDEDSESKIGVSADNPIDACIKMIYKLKEICAI